MILTSFQMQRFSEETLINSLLAETAPAQLKQEKAENIICVSHGKDKREQH